MLEALTQLNEHAGTFQLNTLLQDAQEKQITENKTLENLLESMSDVIKN